MQQSASLSTFLPENGEFNPRRVSTRKTARPSVLLSSTSTTEEQRMVVKKTEPRKTSTVRKRTKNDDPDGAKGCHTIFIRQCMFGKEEANNVKAGNGLPPYINSKAARGRLFHSVTNIPLMVDKFNEGYNSDTGDNGVEAAWNIRMGEDRLGEMVDMLPIEKYFAVLWNQFIQTNYPRMNDRAIFPVYTRFIEEFGAEVMRMKMEMVLVKQVVRNYHLGMLDANGVMEILSMLSCIDMSGVVRGIPDAEYEWPHRLLRESLPQFRKKQYNGMTRCKRRVGTPALKHWLVDEHRKVEMFERKVNPLVKNGKATTELWLTELVDREAELTANLCFEK